MKVDTTLECFSKAIELDANYAKAYNGRGIAYRNLKEYKRAIEDYNKAIELNVNYTKAYYNRGNAYNDLTEYERAVEDYNKAIELNVNYTKAYIKRGLAYYDLKEYKRAIEDYNKAIDLDATHAHAYNNRGLAYVRSGHYERAMEDFEKVIELNQEPGIKENVVTDQSQNLMTEFSINYDISSNDSAGATIYIDIINSNEYTLWLKFLEFYVKGKHSDITNVEIKIPYNRTFVERNCSSSADWDNRSKNLTPSDFCYHAEEKNGIWYKYFCVAIYHILRPGRVTHYYVSYSIDDFTRASKNDTKYLNVPYQSFRNVQVSKCVLVSKCKWFSWDNVPGSDNESLLEILNEDLNITWTENATITKNNNGTIIIRSKDEQHTAKIIMGGNRRDAILEISDGNIRYLKIEKVYGKRCICDTRPTRLKAEDYNILINLPQDRYHYSKLLTVPHPHPDAIFMNENSPALSWHFAPTNRNSTRLLIPAYKIQKDYLMIALDTFVLLSLALGFISIILAVRDEKHKRWRLRIILVVVCVAVIGLYVRFTGLWGIYLELLLEIFKSY